MTNIKCRVSGGHKGIIDGRIVNFFHIPLSQADGTGDVPHFQVFAVVVRDDDGGIFTVEIDHITVRQGALV